MGVNGAALQLHAVYKMPYFLLQVTWESVSVLQVTWESVSVLQVTWESVSGTASHARCIWTCNEIEGSYDKIIITIAPSYTGKNITRLLLLALLLMLHTCNNTHGNKLVIFSGIALYYGDNYINITMPGMWHLDHYRYWRFKGSSPYSKWWIDLRKHENVRSLHLRLGYLSTRFLFSLIFFVFGFLVS